MAVPDSIVDAPHSGRRAREWWIDRVGYEVYVPSFADGDGDGWGDIAGLRSKLPYLADLGAGMLWLSPIFPSPFADQGYDVADYMSIDPRYGTSSELDDLIAEAAGRDIEILLDLVPNHTSDLHPWFRASRESRDAPLRDYYIWRDPSPDGGPPNNWVSVFGGPAWTRDEATGQYYLHMFTPRQPDLNWRDARVAGEFDRIIEFWLARGIAGFRVDVAHGLVKSVDLADQPVVAAERRVRTMVGVPDDWFSLDHVHDFDQPEVVDIHRRWRRIVDRHRGVLLGEVYLLDAAKIARYIADDVLHLAFWFALVESGWEPARFADMLRAADVAGPRLAWTLSSHDSSRAVTRFGGGDVGRRRALALATLTAGLPAMPVLYQGEELGLDDAALAAADIRDPRVLQGGHAQPREVSRTPMPWSPGRNLGFTTAPAPWLPAGDRTARDTVAVQAGDPGSSLSAFRRLLAARRRLADLRHGEMEWIDTRPPVLGYRRGSCVVAANCGDDPSAFEAGPGAWRCEFDSAGRLERQELDSTLELAPVQAVVLARAG